MDIYVLSAVGFAVMVVGVLLFCAYIIVKQQRTIDRLTDRLMARDLSEYRRGTTPLMQEEPRQRKPMSFYDDPAVEVEDDDAH